MPIPGPLIFIPAVLETGGALLLIGLPQILPESAGSRVAKIENEETNAKEWQILLLLDYLQIFVREGSNTVAKNEITCIHKIPKLSMSKIL